MLIHDSGVGELALLVITPGGKISYWESVSSAASADSLRQKKQGVYGAISGVLSSETITSVTEAEPDGFVVASSAGRVFHVSVRDPQGRPVITTLLLRGNNASSGGFLGGIRSVFSSANWRKDIVAVRAGPVRGKSRRHCIIATALGIFQVWDLVRHSTKILDFELDARSYIMDALMGLTGDTKDDEFSVLDFTLFPNTASTMEQEGYRLLVLIAVKRQQRVHYRLVDLRIHDETLEINVVHPITCWNRPQTDDASRSIFKARVLLPEPAHSAFVIFDKCLVMVSLAQVEETPDLQLQLESNLLSDPFQDVLFFARDVDYHVVGCAMDSADRMSEKGACLLFVDGFGLIHAGAFPAKEGEAVDQRRAAACRSKIEQTIFYGSTTGNLLDFSIGLDVTSWQDAEIEAAAIQINDSILNCKSKYIATISPSMEAQLKQRAVALSELIRCVKKWKLSRSSKWHLLWSAEKMAAARAIWQSYTSHLSSKRPEDKVLLTELLDMMSEKFKHENNPEVGETDVVRHYLINDISGIELVIPWAEQALEELYTEGVRDPVQQASLISQANDIQIGALEAAFRFREAHADIYGIGRDVVEDGIYQGNYEDLPDFWTSVQETVVKVKELADLSRESAIHNATSPREGELSINMDVLTKLAKDTPRLVHLCCKVYDERCRVLKSRPNPQSQADGDALFYAFSQIRKELFVKLVDIELPDEGLQLAEKYDDVVAIALVMTKINGVLQERIFDPANTEEEQQDLDEREMFYREKIKSYFQTFGYKWAEAFYTNHLETGTLSQLVDQNGPYMTDFLRSRPDLVKLNWLNEVCKAQNFKKATESLLVAQGQDTSLWNKKIVLSMGKLAILAAKEKSQIDDEAVVKTVRKADRRLAIIEIQERLYAYTRPLLRSAIDETAAVDLAMESFGSRVRKKPVLSKALRQNFEKLVGNRVLEPEELVDTLTLMTATDQIVDDEDFAGQRFFLALNLLNLSTYDDYERKDLHERTVWRRCLIQDDWTSLNQTELKSDEAVARETEGTALFKTLKAGFYDGRSKIVLVYDGLLTCISQASSMTTRLLRLQNCSVQALLQHLFAHPQDTLLLQMPLSRP